MKTLRIECPHCGGSSKLFLASKPIILVLNCPECQSILLHSEGETFKVEDPRIIHMDNREIRDYINELKGYPTAEKRSLSTLNKGTKSLAHRALPSPSGVNNTVRQLSITQDDLLNLKIDLESSMDVTEFLEKM